MASRAQRRHPARHQRVQTVMVGDGIVARGLGHFYRAAGGAALPTKIAGRHRWVAFASYVLTDDQAATAHDDQARNLLGPDSLMYLGVGCWDCEQHVDEVGHDSTCPAPGDD